MQAKELTEKHIHVQYYHVFIDGTIFQAHFEFSL